MALIPYEPFRLFDPFWDGMERRLHSRGKEDLSEYLYRVDVDETKDQIHVTVEIPGIENKEDLRIEVNENVLMIRGEVKRSKEHEGHTSRSSERYFGTFGRKIVLPAQVKADGSHASYRNGILELSFLKDRHPAVRSIEVDFH